MVVSVGVDGCKTGKGVRKEEDELLAMEQNIHREREKNLAISTAA